MMIIKKRKVQSAKRKVKAQRLKLLVLSFSFALCALSFALTYCFAAQDIAFEATVDKNIVELGDNIQLSLTFQGAADIAAPQITEPDGFSAKYLGPSSMVSIVNGRMSSSISHIYILIPLKTGKFTIGPFSAEYNGQTYSSQALEVEVVDQNAMANKRLASRQPSSSLAPAAAGTTEEQLKDRVFVEIDVGKRDVYMNEIMPVTVRLYINRLAIKDIEFPSLMAEGFSMGRFSQPDQYQRTLAGLVYDVIEFKAQAYPLKSGTLTLGPAQIKCNLMVQRQASRPRSGSPFGGLFDDDNFFNDFFNRFETYPLDLKSTEISINVKPLPDENKPVDFSGAVGEFDMQVEPDVLGVKVGDPIILKSRISGRGNFATVNAPVLENLKDFKVYPAQAKMEQNEKLFEQVIMPLSENVTSIPVVSFSFFDPVEEKYKTVKRGPIAISVSKPDQADQLAKPQLVERPIAAAAGVTSLPEKEEVLGKDIIYIKDNPGALKAKGEFLYKNKFFILFIAGCPLIFLFLFLIEKKNQRLRTDIRYARSQRAYKRAKVGLVEAGGLFNAERQEDFYRVIFKTLQEYIGDRLHIASGGITAQSAEQHLTQRAAPEDILEKIRRFFEACDTARFAPVSSAKGQMHEVLRLAKEIVEGLEKVKL
jgi:hypothetical protein